MGAATKRGKIVDENPFMLDEASHWEAWGQQFEKIFSVLRNSIMVDGDKLGALKHRVSTEPTNINSKILHSY